MRLNEQQRKAAETREGVFIVIAGCGSGKTLTMTHRIGYLVQSGIPPENILGLTFTRNAAQTMRDRLVSVLEDLASRVTLSTLHSFCHHILKLEGIPFEVLTDRDQGSMLKKIIRQRKYDDLSVGTVIREISLSKNNLIDVDEFMELYEGDRTMLRIGEVYREYERQKSKKLLLDFDDLLLKALDILSQGNGARDRYRSMFPHILIDEFQDTNPVQMEIVKLLLDETFKASSFWVCGDDWQSIYAFTGASIGNILNFKSMFPMSREYVLSINYRSTPQILSACQNLIRHNQRKIDKTLEARNPSGEDIVVMECSSEEEEAVLVCSEVMSLAQNKGILHRDIAILYRANFQSRVLEEVFSRQRVPYRIENGQGFYQRKEVKWLLDYMKLLSNPDSEQGDEALRAILNVPNRYLGRKFLGELEGYAAKRGTRLWEALREMPVDLPYLKKGVNDLVSFLEPLIANKDDLEPGEVITLIREVMDYDRFVTDEDIPSPDDQKIQNVNQLLIAASRFERIVPFLEHIESFQDRSIQGREDGVRMMTIHKSKGLEFRAVFVVGMVEGILPSRKGDIEEERRICFVGISRAKELLYLCHSRTYLGQPSKKSVFLDEIQAA